MKKIYRGMKIIRETLSENVQNFDEERTVTREKDSRENERERKRKRERF